MAQLCRRGVVPSNSRRSAAGESGHARWRGVLRRPLAHLVAALIVIAVVQGFFVKVFQVSSNSMEKTLMPGDRVLVNRLAFLDSQPAAGDVVVFERPKLWNGHKHQGASRRTVVGWFGDVFGFGPSNSDALIKRIIAGPGEGIFCCDNEGRLVRDGQSVDESDLGRDLPFRAGSLDCDTSPASNRCFPALTIPDKHYLVAGDNRAHSSDGISRCRGVHAENGLDCARLVPRDDIVGSVFLVILPVERWRTLA